MFYQYLMTMLKFQNSQNHNLMIFDNSVLLYFLEILNNLVVFVIEYLPLWDKFYILNNFMKKKII